MRIGEQIREARRRAGFSQRQLAEKMGSAQAVISKIENGRDSPKLETVDSVVRALGLRSIDALRAIRTSTEMLARGVRPKKYGKAS